MSITIQERQTKLSTYITDDRRVNVCLNANSMTRTSSLSGHNTLQKKKKINIYKMPIPISIYSYNIAGKRSIFAENFISNLFQHTNIQSDIIIFCFQELHGHFNQNFGINFRKNYNVMSIQNGCQSISSSFNLATVIITKSTMKFPISIKKQKKCTRLGMASSTGYTLKYYGNKGAIYTLLTIDNKPYFIINTHAPFASEKGILGGSYSSFWNSFIASQILVRKMQGKTFIVGDLNSRSLINHQLSIDITPRIKNATDQHFRYRQPSKNDPNPLQYKIQVQNLLNKAQTFSQMTKQEKKNLELLRDTMIKRDYLTHFLEKHHSNIRDIKTIKFLPTYKINPDTEKYKLMKNNKLRLPGYADRILTDVDSAFIDNTTYNAIKDFGSTDHFPVMAQFNLSII